MGRDAIFTRLRAIGGGGSVVPEFAVGQGLACGVPRSSPLGLSDRGFLAQGFESVAGKRCTAVGQVSERRYVSNVNPSAKKQLRSWWCVRILAKVPVVHMVGCDWI